MLENALDFNGLSHYTNKTKEYISQIVSEKVDSVKIGETEYKSGTVVTLPVYTTEEIDSTFGADIGLTIDTSTYKMTLELKDKNGTVLSSKEIDFPIESMVVNASYLDGILTLTLQNGTRLEVDISSIISGLVPDTRTIAGIDLKDDITATELKTALDITGDINTFSTIKIGDSEILATSATDTITLVAGDNVTIESDTEGNKITISSTDTTYDLASTIADGLMSKEDKSKIESLSSGSVVGVKGDAEDSYRTGNVNLTAEDIGALSVDGTAESSSTIVDYGDATNLIQIGWRGDSLTADTFKHFAAYTVDSDNKVKIKDISSDTVKNILGISGMIQNIELLLSNKMIIKHVDELDCNNIFDTGIYQISRGKNAPSKVAQYGVLLVMSYRKSSGNTTTDFVVQIFLPNGDDPNYPNSMFYRTSIKEGWNEWQEVSTYNKTPIGGGIEFQIVDGKLQYRYDTEVWG